MVTDKSQKECNTESWAELILGHNKEVKKKKKKEEVFPSIEDTVLINTKKYMPVILN